MFGTPIGGCSYIEGGRGSNSEKRDLFVYIINICAMVTSYTKGWCGEGYGHICDNTL